MKKYSLIKYFTIFSLITFLITGVVLSFTISKHIRDDKLANLIEVTQITIDSITRNGFVESDFDDILSGSKKTNIAENIMKAMSLYDPESVTIYNSKKTVIFSNRESTEVKGNINTDNISKILTSTMPSIISKVYNIKDPGDKSGVEPLIDTYVPVKCENKIVGVLILQIPDKVISAHVNMLVQAIVLTLSGGLLILFLLLIRILYNASKTLIKQNSDLTRQKMEIEASYKKLNDSYKSTVFALSNAVDARDPYTAGHSERVTNISLSIGKALHMTEEELRNLEYAALFHDIGKIGVPDYILLKKGKLTNEEFDIIKKHPAMGISILKTIDFLINALPIIKHHHERFMGNGYPDHLKGENIPLGSRIIAIADTYDAMTSDRPYWQGLSHEAAVAEILRNKGLQFDDELVDVFMQIEKKII